LGEAIITVTTEEGGFTATCTVMVKPPVVGVTLDRTTALLIVGSTSLTLTATVLPNDAIQAITWSSSNENVATVNNGAVTAVAEGEAVITVTTVIGNKTATCTVTVIPIPKITGITVGGNEALSESGNNFRAEVQCGEFDDGGGIEVKVYVDYSEAVAEVVIDGTAQESHTVYLNNLGENIYSIVIVTQDNHELSYTLTIHKPIPFEDLVITRWDNTMTVYTHPVALPGYTFNALCTYQWYRDGMPIAGATGQTWSASENGETLPAGTYHVEAQTPKGTVRSCGNSFTPSSAPVVVLNAYPSPVFFGQTLYIEADETYNHAKVDIYSIFGNYVGSLHLQGLLTPVDMRYTAGAYVFVIKNPNGTQERLKIIVK
jgi:uncharacterized spore protein YtfJ